MFKDDGLVVADTAAACTEAAAPFKLSKAMKRPLHWSWFKMLLTKYNVRDVSVSVMSTCRLAPLVESKH